MLIPLVQVKRKPCFACVTTILCIANC